MKHRSVALVAVAVLAFVACGGEDQTGPVATVPTTSATPSTTDTTPVPSTSTSVEAPPPKPALADLEKGALHTLSDGFSNHDAKTAGGVYTDDAVISHPGMGGTWHDTNGRSAIEKHWTELFGAYPDVKMGAERVFAAKNVVVVQWIIAGTNTGDMGDMKATKKPVGVHGASVMWFNDDGLITKEHVYFDMLTFMAQEGRSKEKARDVAALPTGAPEWITSDDPTAGAGLANYKSEFDAFNKHDAKAMSATLAPDFTMVSYGSPKDVKAADVGKEMGMLFKMLPDIAATSDNLWAFGDWTVCEMTATGTMKGNMGPLKATNKPVTGHRLELEMVKDGKTSVLYAYENNMEFISQVMPEKMKEKIKEKKEAEKANK